jgi:hypothetical protein
MKVCRTLRSPASRESSKTPKGHRAPGRAASLGLRGGRERGKAQGRTLPPRCSAHVGCSGASAAGGLRATCSEAARRPAGENLEGDPMVQERIGPPPGFTPGWCATDSAAGTAVPRGGRRLWRRGNLCRTESQPQGCSRYETRPAGRDTARIAVLGRVRPRARFDVHRETRRQAATRVRLPAGGVVVSVWKRWRMERGRTRLQAPKGRRSLM